MNLGARIKQIRKMNGYKSQTLFAEALGTTRPAIAAYELNKVTPNDVFLKLISVKFHINETWLRTGEGELSKTGGSIDEAEINSLAVKYHLDEEEKSLLHFFLYMPQNERRGALQFLKNAMKAMAKGTGGKI